MKYQLNASAAARPCYVRPAWLSETLGFGIEMGWTPAVPCRIHAASRGVLCDETYTPGGPGSTISPDDAAELAAALERWWDGLIVGGWLSAHARETDNRATTRRDFAAWLRSAGTVTIEHGRPWDARRLAGTALVRLSNGTGDAFAVPPAAYLDILEAAAAAGWHPAGAGSDSGEPLESIYRPDFYDAPKALIEATDAGELVAALKRAKPLLAAGWPREMLPPDARAAARLLELYEAGRHRGAGWIRLELE